MEPTVEFTWPTKTVAKKIEHNRKFLLICIDERNDNFYFFPLNKYGFAYCWVLSAMSESELNFLLAATDD